MKEGRKVSGSCAEILLTCTYLYLSKMKEGMSNERRNEELKRRKEGFWFLRRNLTYLYLLELKNVERIDIREKELRKGINNGQEKE